MIDVNAALAIISSRSRRLRLYARYQRTHSRITERLKWRPENMNTPLKGRNSHASAKVENGFATKPLRGGADLRGEDPQWFRGEQGFYTMDNVLFRIAEFLLNRPVSTLSWW